MKPLLLRCPRCESTQFIIKANPQPKDLATCGRCRGRFIYGHLTDEAEAEATRAARPREQQQQPSPTPASAAREAPSTACLVWRWLRLRCRSGGDRTQPPSK